MVRLSFILWTASKGPRSIHEELLRAAREVAKKSSKNARKTESELVKMLKAHESDVNAAKEGAPSPTNLQELIKTMKVAKTEKEEPPVPRRPRVAEFEERVPPPPPLRPPPSSRFAPRSRREVNIFTNESLGIFDAVKDQGLTAATDGKPEMLRTWKSLQQEELKRLVTQPPTNAYEEMIQWTEQGKLWKYPINNEDGLEAEAEVPFYEHIYMDDLLDDETLPQVGPVREFLELVVVSLSKTPFISVERKRLHFEWFKQYLLQNKDILVRAGIYDVKPPPEETQPKP